MSLANSPTSTGATTAALSPAAFQVPPPNTATTIFNQFGQGQQQYYQNNHPLTAAPVPTNAIMHSGVTTPNGGLQVGATPNGGAVPGALYASTQHPGAWSQLTPAQQAAARAAQSGPGFLSSLGTALGTGGGMILAGLALIAVIATERK